jgi:periplasmic mercuric ion binding protein
MRYFAKRQRTDGETGAGVTKAVVSYKDKTAVVTFDDGRTDLPALTRATTDAGYSSAPRS